MEGPKFDRQRGATPETKETEAQLDGAKTPGNKLELLEALLVEGKLSRTPYAGPQALKTEGDVSSHELITGAVIGTQSKEVDAAQALDPGQRTALITRVLEERPHLSAIELRAACEMLEIDPDPFLKRMTEIKTEKLSETIEQARKDQKVDQVVLTLLYESRQDLGPVLEQFKQQNGQTVQERLEQAILTPRDKASLELAMLGRPESPREELDRINAAVSFERMERYRARLLLVQPNHVHLDSADDQLGEARKLLRGDDLLEDDNHDRFSTLLGDARENLRKYYNEAPAYDRDPIVFISAVIAALCIAAIVAIEFSLGRNYVLASSIIAIGALGASRFSRESRRSYAQIEEVKKKYLTPSQIRGLEKSRRLKARLRR